MKLTNEEIKALEGAIECNIINERRNKLSKEVREVIQ